MLEEQGKKEEGEVYVDKDGIICFGTGESPTEESVEKTLNKATEILRELKGQGRVLVHTSPYTASLSGARIRSKLANKTKELFKEIGFKKIAIFGGDTMSRTITSFIIMASGIKNMKVFKERAKALAWLKK